MKGQKPKAKKWLFSLWRYLIFFLLMAFVVTCCMVLFLNEVTRVTGLELTREHIEQAAKLLRQTNMSITEVAYCCGFSSSSYFSENFLKQKGITPSMFRKISYDK